MKYFLLNLIFLTHLQLFAQFVDNFEDSNLQINPTWQGDDSVFTIVAQGNNQLLRSNKSEVNSSFYLSTPSSQIAAGQWEFYTFLNFNTSSANFVDVYLSATLSNLLSPTNEGYFIRIGGSTDEISLFKKVGVTVTKLIDGADGTTNSTNNTLRIKVVRSSSGEWTLARDLLGNGNNYITEGVSNDSSITTSAYFGLVVNQSTASFHKKHFFDDFYVGPEIVDLTPPNLLTINVLSATQIDLLFDEALDSNSVQNTANYTIQPPISVSHAQRTQVNTIRLTVAQAFTNGNSYSCSVSNVQDLNQNSALTQTLAFTYLVAEQPEFGDVIITEFLCDETPSVGLPLVEYVEIYNRSAKYFQLQGWKLGDNSSDGTLQAAWLHPGEYRILCTSTRVDSFDRAVGVTSFPSLNNSADDIVLMDVTGNILDKISYTTDWYRDNTKKDGGYSIELIHPNHPCSNAPNWRASVSISGGTPNAQNSVFDTSPDTLAPHIVHTKALPPNFLEITYSESMDSTTLKLVNVQTNPTLSIFENFVPSAFTTQQTLVFNEAITPSTNYTILLENAADCWGNASPITANFILPEVPTRGDILLNEILFDPVTGGSDWVELYNSSSKVIDLKNWSFANYTDTIANPKPITSTYLLPPGGYAVIGADSSLVKQHYPFAVPGTFIQSALPSYPNDSGTVYLIYQDSVMDYVSYSEKWHFQLLDDTDGISLERLDPGGLSNNPHNWHSAAEAIGFGTPGGKNSQFIAALYAGDFSFTNPSISPDNDGFEDVLHIQYAMQEPGMVGNLTIYDDRGRVIRHLLQNELLAKSGTFIWDGVTENGTKAAIGSHVAVFEAYSIHGGAIFVKRKPFLVAGKL